MFLNPRHPRIRQQIVKKTTGNRFPNKNKMAQGALQVAKQGPQGCRRLSKWIPKSRKISENLICMYTGTFWVSIPQNDSKIHPKGYQIQHKIMKKLQNSKPASQPANKPTSKPARKPASQQANQQVASQQASGQQASSCQRGPAAGAKP